MKNVFFPLLLFLVFGCNRTLTSLEYSAATATRGVYYHLPKSVIQVAIDFTVKRAYHLVNGVKVYQGDAYATIDGPVRVSTLAVPDTSQRYILTYKKQDNHYFFDDHYSVEVSTDGSLKAVNWETEHVLPDILADVVTTGLNIFKTSSPAIDKSALADGESLIAGYEAEIERLDGEILAASKKSQADLKKLLSQQELLTLRVARLKLLYQRDQTETKKVSQTVYLNLEGDYRDHPLISKAVQAGRLVYIIDLKSRFKGITEESFPKVKFSLPESKARENGTEGIRYRRPQQVTYSLDLLVGEGAYPETHHLAEAPITILQYGDVNAFPMQAKGSKKAKMALTIDEKTGLITKVSNTSNSMLKASAGLAKEASADLLATFDNYNFNKAKKELENEKALLELMESIDKLKTDEPAASEIEQLIARLRLQLEKLELEQQIRELQDSGQ